MKQYTIFFFLLFSLFITPLLAQTIGKSDDGSFYILMPDGSYNDYDAKNKEHKQLMANYEKRLKGENEKGAKVDKKAHEKATVIAAAYKAIDKEKVFGESADNAIRSRVKAEYDWKKFIASNPDKKNSRDAERLENWYKEQKDVEKNARSEFKKAVKESDDARRTLFKNGENISQLSHYQLFEAEGVKIEENNDIVIKEKEKKKKELAEAKKKKESDDENAKAEAKKEAKKLAEAKKKKAENSDDDEKLMEKKEAEAKKEAKKLAETKKKKAENSDDDEKLMEKKEAEAKKEAKKLAEAKKKKEAENSDDDEKLVEKKEAEAKKEAKKLAEAKKKKEAEKLAEKKETKKKEVAETKTKKENDEGEDDNESKQIAEKKAKEIKEKKLAEDKKNKGKIVKNEGKVLGNEQNEPEIEKKALKLKTEDNVILNPPYPECEIAFNGKDEFTNLKRIETAKQILFKHTDEIMLKYYEKNDFLTCEVSASRSDKGYKYLNFLFTFNSDNVQNTYGVLEKDQVITLRFLDGETMPMFNTKTDRGFVDVMKKTTSYKAVVLVNSNQEKKLFNGEIDQIRVLWGTGTDDYAVYDLDFFINILNCVK